MDNAPEDVSGGEGGVKFDSNKTRYDLLAWLAIREVADVYTFGAKKYADHNWRKGMKYMRLIAAAYRHMAQWVCGETHDSESGLHHLAHAAFSLLAIVEFQKQGTYEKWDDRPYNTTWNRAPKKQKNKHTSQWPKDEKK